MKRIKQSILTAFLFLTPFVNFSQCENLNGDFSIYTGPPAPIPFSEHNEAINDGMPGWFVSHGSPNIKTYPGERIISMASTNGVFNEGVFTPYNFEVGETYTVSYDLWFAAPYRPDSRVFVGLTSGYTPTDDENTPIYGTGLWTSLQEHEWEVSSFWSSTTGPGVWNSYSHTFVATEAYTQLAFHTFELAPSGLPFSTAGINNVCIEKVPLADPCDFTPNPTLISSANCAYVFENTMDFPVGAGFSILESTWDFGDGTTATGDVVTHSYETTGGYEVCLTVWATNGVDCCKKTKCRSFEFQACDLTPCEITENASLSIVDNGSGNYNFSETAVPNGTDYAFYWEFGDGTTATGKNVNHTYSSAGTYEACLTVFYFDTVTNECCSFKICQTINADLTMAPQPAPDQNGGAVKESSQAHIALPSINTSIYPNPSDGNFLIETDSDHLIYSLVVYDQSGKVVKKETDLSGRLRHDLDLSSLVNGLYVLILNPENKGQSSQHKIIIN